MPATTAIGTTSPTYRRKLSPWQTKHCSGPASRAAQFGRQVIRRCADSWNGPNPRVSSGLGGLCSLRAGPCDLPDHAPGVGGRQWVNSTTALLPHRSIVVDEPYRVQPRLTLGGVYKRHFGRLHPVLARSRLTKEVWCDLLRAIDSAPRIPGAEFAAIRKISPGAIVLIACMAAPWTLTILGVVLRKSGNPTPSACALAGILWCPSRSAPHCAAPSRGRAGRLTRKA